MNPVKIQLADCIQCGECASACLYNAIYMDEYPVIDQSHCLLCKSCINSCPLGLISIEETATNEDAPCCSEAQGIWVLAEFRDGLIAPVTYELLGAARRLSDISSEEVSVILIGASCKGHEESLIAAGANHIYIAESSYLADRLEEMISEILVEMVGKFRPNILLIGASHWGRGVSARTASILHTGLTADCTQLEIAPSSKRLLQIRPAFGGNLLATIETPLHRPQMASVRPRVMTPAKLDHERVGRITKYDVRHLVTNNRVELLAEEVMASCSSVTDASVLIAGGKGMQSKENVRLLYKLADLLGGKVAASRAAVEAGWLPYECQVGQTGQTVKPLLYIACGISGQVQHTVAMSEAQTIIAINNDPYAPIFQYADYGIIGNISEILPALIQELQGKAEITELC
ncbi:FAD-binding protein [Bacteroides sp.]|uniref:FAD-binding protein n=1 Tax=Bacteroides sp. TaxID=29523 RepID=UPI003AB21774